MRPQPGVTEPTEGELIMNRLSRMLTVIAAVVLGLSMNATALAQSSDTIEITIAPPPPISVVVDASFLRRLEYSNYNQSVTGRIDFTSSDPRFDQATGWTATASVSGFVQTPNGEETFAADINLTVITEPDCAVASAPGTHIDSGLGGEDPATDLVIDVQTVFPSVCPREMTTSYLATLNVPGGTAPANYASVLSVTVAGPGCPPGVQCQP